MNKKIIIGFLGLVLVAVFGIIAFRGSRPTDSYAPSGGSENTNISGSNMVPSANTTSSPSDATGTTPVANSYSLSQVAQHADPSDCWSAINGGVYNLTDWIAKHPGGRQAIISICGKDGSSAFNNQHYGNGKVASILASFKIGTLNANQ